MRLGDLPRLEHLVVLFQGFHLLFGLHAEFFLSVGRLSSHVFGEYLTGHDLVEVVHFGMKFDHIIERLLDERPDECVHFLDDYINVEQMNFQQFDCVSILVYTAPFFHVNCLVVLEVEGKNVGDDVGKVEESAHNGEVDLGQMSETDLLSVYTDDVAGTTALFTVDSFRDHGEYLHHLLENIAGGVCGEQTSVDDSVPVLGVFGNHEHVRVSEHSLYLRQEGVGVGEQFRNGSPQLEVGVDDLFGSLDTVVAHLEVTNEEYVWYGRELRLTLEPFL
uniref:Uncharacterized protein n=1 Tax=Cacopsylla melanoneura TaxID=428564 RepID=A0A8D8Y3Q4_9HEMI